MRKYQRKLVRECAELYQSNDPMHWVYLSLKFGQHGRVMTAREQRIFMKRLTRQFKNISEVIKRVMGEIPKMISNVVANVGQMLQFMKDNPIDPMPITLHDPKMDHALGKIAVEPKIIGNIPDLQISVDTTEHV